MFESVVDQLKASYSQKQQYFVTHIEGEEKGQIAAVDGGAAILWSNTVKSIGVILSGYIVYDEHHEITSYHTTEKEVLIEGDDLDVYRFQSELSSLAEAAQICDCVLFDGALVDVPRAGFSELLDKVDVTVMGISKKTRLSSLENGIPDTDTLNYPGKWCYRIENKNPMTLGDVYIARLHERGPSFRVDVKGKPLFERLVYFSKYLFCLGYPYPLMEIHRATTLRDKREHYQAALQEAMFAQGLEDDYIQGVYHLERAGEEFHQVLDGLV